MEMEFSTKAILEEQRCAIVDQANFELNIQEAKAENIVHKFETAFPSTIFGAIQQKSGMKCGDQQLHHARKSSSGNSMHMNTEVEDLRDVRCSSAELRKLTLSRKMETIISGLNCRRGSPL